MLSLTKQLIASAIIAIGLGVSFVHAGSAFPPETYVKTFSHVCGDPGVMMETILADYRERILFLGDVDASDQSQVAVFYSKGERTFTVLELRKDTENKDVTVACVMTSGTATMTMEALTNWHTSLKALPK